LTAAFEDGSEVEGIIVSNDVSVDLCAAEINSKIPALTITKYDEAKNLITRGYPGGLLYEGHGYARGKIEWDYEIDIDLLGDTVCPKNSKVRFYLSGKIRSCTVHWTSILTNLYSRPGSSGSPILDDAGYLAGVMSSHDSNFNDFSGGMVPTDQVRAFLDKL
jgi:hypothetical protein